MPRGMYCKWRDPLLSDGAKLFERGGVDHAHERLEYENRKRGEAIGEPTIVQERVNRSANPVLLGVNPAAQGGTSVLGLSSYLDRGEGVWQNPPAVRLGYVSSISRSEVAPPLFMAIFVSGKRPIIYDVMLMLCPRRLIPMIPKMISDEGNF